MIEFEYNSNNSGGSWWLSDEDWLALEKAGWKVQWVKDQKGRLFSADLNGRWLGALATSAKGRFNNRDEAIASFEKVTGEDYYAEGCNCCGKPHSIWEA